MKTFPALLGWFCVQSVLLLSAAEFSAVEFDESTQPAQPPRGQAGQQGADVDLQKRLAKNYLDEHLESEAIIAAEAALALAPNDGEAKRLHVTALARYGRYEDAIAAQSTDSAEWLTDRQTKKVMEAAVLARQAENQMRQTASAGMQPDFQGVANLLEQAIKLDPDNPAIRLTLGWVYLDKAHRPEKAYRHLTVAVKQRPNDPNARKLLGSACIQTGRPEQAVKELQTASMLKPDDQWTRANLARSLTRLGRYSEASAIYTEVLVTEPTNAPARLGQAEMAAWQGRSAVPLEQLEVLTREDPKNVEALVLMGDIHRWNWRLTEAKLHYQHALDIDGNNSVAKTGLAQAERMGASDIGVKGYVFEDTTDFRRESVEASTRLRLADRVYFLARGAGWRFTHPAFEDFERLDGLAGLELHWSRWLETTIEGGAFKYDHDDAFAGGRANVKLSPTPHFDLYAAPAVNLPFVSSINTVSNALREDSIGAGFDLRMGSRFSVQSSVQLARISDDNEWVQIKPQISYRLFGKPGTFIRVEYDYLDYAETNATYWTPQDRHVVSPVFDTTIPLGGNIRLVVNAKAPWVFDEDEFGFQGEGGLIFDFRHVELRGTFFFSDIPGDLGAWSGKGGMASVRFRF